MVHGNEMIYFVTGAWSISQA